MAIDFSNIAGNIRDREGGRPLSEGFGSIASNQGGGPAGMTFGEAASVSTPKGEIETFPGEFAQAQDTRRFNCSTIKR